jgi:CHAT domain-containing protein/tetratricopeptide (TPR) repeat protein
MCHTALRFGFALTFIVLSAIGPFARQGPTSKIEVAHGLDEARRLFSEHKMDDAAAAFEAIVDAAHRLGLEAEEGEALCGLGETLIQRAKYDNAQTTLQRCLEASERMHSERGIGRASVSLSQVADLTGHHADAVAFADRAVASYDAIEDPRGRAVARLQLMGVRQLSVAEDQALVDRIIADARLVNDRVLEADALHALGDYLFNAARFVEAFDTLTRARGIYHQADSFGDEGTTLNSLGRVYRAHGRLDEALKCQQQALALHEKYGTPFELMQSNNAVAVVQNQLGNLGAARDHYERALAIARQSSSVRIQDFLNANLASLLMDEGEYLKAARMIEEIISHGVDSYPSIRYGDLSAAYRRLKRPQDALTAAERAVAACGSEQLRCLEALEIRAAAYSAVNDDDNARADLRKALDTIEAVRIRLVPSDFLKQNFHEVQRNIYSAAIALAFSHHDDRESLQTAELASSRAFLDLLAEREGLRGGGHPNPELTLRGASEAVELPNQTTAAPATAEDFTAIARRIHSTVVVYWPADEALFAWVVRPDGRVASHRVEVSKARLVELIRATEPVDRTPRSDEPAAPGSVLTRGAAQLSAVDPADRRAWRQLYDVLVEPIRDQLPRTQGSLLTIIPHGVLMNVSFAALQARDGRYLLEDYALHYAPAGAVLQFTAAMRRRDARSGATLLVADPSTVRRSPLDPLMPPLPGSRQEVARIAALIPRSRVTLLEGREATESRVTAAVAGKTVVHFATHAIVRDDAPNDSYLAFGPGGDSTTGLLSARDVYDLRLNADLVVLTACRSGGGRITGDGVATFARAFIYAGTPSLVASLWDVADEPTSRLLPAFYKTWLGGASKARSLRRAQLQLLAELRAGTVRVETRAGPIVLPEHPMFWAGFVLIGEPD